MVTQDGQIQESTNLSSAAQKFQKDLEHAIAVKEQTIQLSETLRRNGVSIDNVVIDDMHKHLETLKRQNNRLKANQFVIAVVGLEKAGKSTFVNAWLGIDLLPSRMERCTFTTTRLFSRVEQGHILEIEVMSQREFKELEDKLKVTASGDDFQKQFAQKDLENIDKHRTSLESVIRQGNLHFQEDELEDLEVKLWDYVANPQYAHAIKEVKLHTSRLSRVDGVVFYDVPGLDSGMLLTEDETQNILANCDAIIVLKNARTPSLNAGEQRILAYATKGDTIAIKDKLFVFLGQADRLGGNTSAKTVYEAAKQEWQERVKLDSKRIFIGSALADLVKHGTLRQATSETHGGDTGGFDTIEHNLHMAMQDFGYDSVDDETGLRPLKKRINHFLTEERVGLLKQRCNEGLKAIRAAADSVLRAAKETYPDDTAVAERLFRERRTPELIAWAARHINQVIIPKVVQKHQALSTDNQLLDKYQTEVKTRLSLKGISSLSYDQAQNLFHRYAGIAQSPEEADFEWRKAIHSDVKQTFSTLGVELANTVFAQLSSLLQSMVEHLWDDESVIEVLVGSKESYRQELESGLVALLNRYSRPLFQAMLEGPHGSLKRSNIWENVTPDLEAIQIYAKPEGKDDLPLLKSCKDARASIIIKESQTKPPPKEVPPPQVEEVAAPEATEGRAGWFSRNNVRNKDQPQPPLDSSPSKEPPLEDKVISSEAKVTTSIFGHLEEHINYQKRFQGDTLFTDIMLDVESDFKMMTLYLHSPVFYASGLSEFREQEFNRLLEKFNREQSNWLGVTVNAFEKNHVKLLNLLPENIKDEKAYLDVVTEVASLKTSLKQMRDA